MYPPYKASALPLPKKFAKKFEAAMFRFLWIGKLEKLKIDKIKNSLLLGGLNLPCVLSKDDSLFLSQTCRLLKEPEYIHVKYWLGLYVKDNFPNMGEGPHAEIISPYFQHMRALLSVAITVEDIDVRRLHLVSSKELYLGFTSTFPPPKVVFKFDVDWLQVWSSVQEPVLEVKSREIFFMIIHNIVANKKTFGHASCS